MADILLQKSQIVSEDLQIGLGKVQQKRGIEQVELTEINASELLGILVIDTVEQLEVLEPDRMKARVVFVNRNQCIYAWNGSEWATSTNNIFVVDSITNKGNIPAGYKIVYSIAENKIYYKAGEQWVANGNYVYVVPTSQDISLLPTGAKMAITIDSGALYVNNNGAWGKIKLEVNGDPILIVDTVDELPKSVNNILTAVVKDRKRGGIFLYDSSYAHTNDGGIIFNGWRRQYEGKVSVLWFDADNNGLLDSSSAFNAAFNHKNVIIPAGEYKIANLVICNEDCDIEAFGATVKLVDNACIQFGVENTQESEVQLGNITGGSSQFTLDSVNLYEEGKYARFTATKSSSTFSGHTTAMATQISKLVNLNGLACFIGDFFKFTTEAAKVKVIRPYKINIKGLTVEATTDNTCLQFINVCDSIIDTLYVTSRYGNCMSMKDCANFKLNNAVLNNETTGSFTALQVNGCDNLIIDSTIIKSTNCGIEFITTPSNVIGIYRSVINSNKSINNNGLTMSLNVSDTQLVGNIFAGGYNLAFKNCTMLMSYVYLLYYAGGKVEFTDCDMIGTSTDVSYNFIRVSNNLLFESFKLSQPTNWVVRNCTFSGTEMYSGKALIECISVNSNNQMPMSQGNVFIENVSTMVNLGCIAFLYGYFENVKITGLNNNSVNIAGVISRHNITACDIKQLYLQNLKATLAPLGLNPAYTIIEKFYTDLIIEATIVKVGAEVSGNITREYTQSEQGFLIDQVIGCYGVDIIPPVTATKSQTNGKITIGKLKVNDKIKFIMKYPLKVRGDTQDAIMA